MGRKSEGTGITNPNPKEENTMAKVTYRGISYDTDARKEQETKQVQVSETYRGIKHTEQVRRPYNFS